MKKEWNFLYIVLAIFIVSVCLIYDGATKATPAIYFSLIYFSIFICIIVGAVKESFNKCMLLRKSSRISNAIIYIKKILICAILYSLVFVCSQLIVEVILQKNCINIELIIFYMKQLLMHIVAWSMWGLCYYLIYSLTINKILSVIITWICCNAPTTAEGILFRPGKYMYNAFKYLVEKEITTVDSIKLMHSIKGVIFIMIFIIGICIVQKKKNYIGKM